MMRVEDAVPTCSAVQVIDRLNDEFREVSSERDRLRAECEALTRERSALKVSHEEQDKILLQYGADLDDATADVEELSAEIADLEIENVLLRGEIDRLQDEGDLAACDVCEMRWPRRRMAWFNEACTTEAGHEVLCVCDGEGCQDRIPTEHWKHRCA